jgi:hypothetical protein
MLSCGNYAKPMRRGRWREGVEKKGRGGRAARIGGDDIPVG